MGMTVELAEFVATTSYDELPLPVVEQLKIFVLDALACGYAGARLPWAAIVVDTFRDGGAPGDCSVFGQPGGRTPGQAALFNGVMIGGFEVDHSGHLSHPASTVGPAAFALAEQLHATGRDLITALALGYETACRLGDAQTRATEDERGFHNPGINGPFGAAAAAGRLLDLDPGTQAAAFGIAGSHAGGLAEYAWDGSMTKRLHLGRAAQGGLDSALLAAHGFTGPATIIEGRYGYLNAFSPSPRPDRLLARLGQEWRLQSLRIKAYPCHLTCQGIVSVMDKLRGMGEFPEGELTGIHIKAGPLVIQERYLDPAPRTLLAAQHSVPFTAAVAALRDLSDPTQYDESTLADPRVLKLSRQVTWERVDKPAESVEVEVELHAGTLAVSRCEVAFLGSVENPASFDDVCGKFQRFSRRLIGAARQRDVMQAVHELEELDDVAALFACLRS